MVYVCMHCGCECVSVLCVWCVCLYACVVYLLVCVCVPCVRVYVCVCECVLCV